MGPENAYGLRGLQEVYPIPGVATILHSEFYFDGDLTAPTGAECRPEWNRLLGLLKQLRLQERPGEQASGGARVMPKYYGVLPSEAACWGGLGYRPGAVSMGLVHQDKVSAHEIGHNLNNVSEDQVTVVAGGRLYLPLVAMGPEIEPAPAPSSAE